MASMLLAPVYDVSWERREKDDMMSVVCRYGVRCCFESDKRILQIA